MNDEQNKVTGTFFWKQPQLSRRLFFRHVMSAVGGYFLLPTRPMETVARAAGTPISTAKNCIFVLMSGGPSHVDTFDLKEGAWTPAYMAPTSYGDIRFPQGLMPTIAEHVDSVAFLRSVRSWALVHELGRTWVQIGRNPISGIARLAPHIGSVVSLELGDRQSVLPAFVSLNTGSGPGNGYFEPRHAPFYVTPNGGGLPNTSHPEGNVAFDRRYELARALDAETSEGALGPETTEIAEFSRGARMLMYNSDVDQVFRFAGDEKNRYGGTTNGNGNNFGNSCITARNLLRANLGTRFIQITIGGWDMHAGIYTPNASLQALGRQFDLGLGNLIADLKADGLFDDTLIIAMGEFGRTVGAPNGGGGRDHFLQQAVMVAGAKVRGGRAIGQTDSAGRAIADPGWSRGREMRAEDIEATIYSALGIDWTTIRRDDPTGRGFEYVPFADRDQYGPIHELWG
jgi:hypothetical protein